MNAAAFFSSDYGTARDRFREAARGLGIPVESHAIAAQGPQGELLSIDAAIIGPENPRRVVIVSSGLHGVEGFLGAAAQLAWLAKLGSAAKLPKQLKIVLVHALNPFGFAWLRRWNERNVDLNRNFLTDRRFIDSQEYRQTREAYDRLTTFLNPACPPSRCEPYTLKAAWRVLRAGYSARQSLSAEQRPSLYSPDALWQLGVGQLQKTLLVGQYQHKNGLFYGGEENEETTEWLQERLPVWIGGAGLTIHVDIHSGLGKWAQCQLLIVDRNRSERARWVAERFGDDRVKALDDRMSYESTGTMAAYFRDRNSGGLYHGLTVEFGTYRGYQVLGALRAENQAHFYADRSSSGYRWAKAQVLEAFAPRSAEWRETVVETALAVVARAIEVCAGNQPGYRVGHSSG